MIASRKTSLRRPIVYPILCPNNDNKYVNKSPFEYKDCIVPEGYITNGANIPRIFWSIVPPFKPKYMHAVLIHDYLCDKEQYKKADEYFKELLFAAEYSFITYTMVMLVKIYHKLKYGE